MGLNRLVRPALAVAAFTVSLAWAVHDLPQADGNFGGSAGSSGIGGVTCASCHQPPHPTRDDAGVALDGLPKTWRLGATYELRLAVTGGPDAMPAPAPQGGFDLASDGGSFAPDPAQPDAFLVPMPNEITYTAEGALQRGWTVLWTAPGLERKPAPVHFWLAALSANGNHVVALGRADGGETFDSTATLQATVLPDPDAVAAWEALPLLPPTARAVPAVPATEGSGGWTIEGRHQDGNATQLLYRIDGGPWTLRETGQAWRIRAPAGDHTFDYRSDGAGRSSAVQTLILGEGSDHDPAAQASGGAAAAPFPSIGIPIILALAALHRRNP